MSREPFRERRSAPGTTHGDQAEVLGMADHDMEPGELLAIRNAGTGRSTTPSILTCQRCGVLRMRKLT